MPKGVTYNQSQSDQAEAIADALKNSGGIPVIGGGGGGGNDDASATNQTTQIERETEIRDRIGNTPVNGAIMPTGGVGLFGWLSAIWLLLGTLFAKGQAVMANSISVAIASNQTAVPVVVQDGLIVSGSIATLGNLFVQDATGYQSVSIQVTNAGVGCTITFESSNDNTNFSPVVGIDPSNANTNALSTTNALGTRNFPCTGKYFRARVSAYGSGTVSAVAVFRTFPITHPILNAIVSQSSATSLLAQVAGSQSQGNSITTSSLPVIAGAESRTTQRGPTADSTVSRIICDKLGRTIVKIGQIRELQQNDFIIITNTSETTLIAAGGAGILNDITDLIISNTGVMTATRVDIRDSTGGTVRFSILIPALTTLTFSFAGTLKQSAANAAWTAQLSAAASDIRITAISEKTA
ncbi:MAG: hypothetical protein RMZ41_003280 [Nostoc sp. DedVER02]|uniref:hypothetical protein n=1 Tax=unclassified Nostoc TaxID=2593658 RepID=UPI002AD3B661|nr:MULTISPECIES: hypothetical protein [unclassified Nostoc]MDZ7986821.1 hypothetical protein [Nostoc sp. DedVER02]MDZ8115723.1 hypothetical protein [Nostoc sp. DedVER01b]